MSKLTILTCMVCGEQWEGPEPLMCCSGDMCSCRGMPVDPIICSEECYYKFPFIKNRNNELNNLDNE